MQPINEQPGLDLVGKRFDEVVTGGGAIPVPVTVNEEGVITGIAPPPVHNPSALELLQRNIPPPGMSQEAWDKTRKLNAENMANIAKFKQQHEERRRRGTRTVTRGRPLIAQMKRDRLEDGRAEPLVYTYEHINGKREPYVKEGPEPGRNDWVTTTVNGQEVRVKYKNLSKLKETQA
jgi:hypothetical protein